MNITADVIDYLGKYENGVIVLLSINYNNSFTEGTLYYSNVMLALTVDESIEREIGQIELWDGYKDLIISILKKVVPYDEIINRLDEINFSEYLNPDISSSFGEEIDEKDINTQDT
jgi:hypothetical protein